MHVGSTGRGTKLGCAWLRRDALVASAAQRFIIHSTFPGTINVPLRLSAWRDLLVRSVTSCLMMRFGSAGTTGMPLQFCLSEESPCRVRRTTLDHPSLFCGHDRHVPPILSLGGTRRVGPSRKSTGVSTFQPSNYKDMPPDMVSRQTGLSAVLS